MAFIRTKRTYHLISYKLQKNLASFLYNIGSYLYDLGTKYSDKSDLHFEKSLIRTKKEELEAKQKEEELRKQKEEWLNAPKDAINEAVKILSKSPKQKEEEKRIELANEKKSNPYMDEETIDSFMVQLKDDDIISNSPVVKATAEFLTQKCLSRTINNISPEVHEAVNKEVVGILKSGSVKRNKCCEKLDFDENHKELKSTATELLKKRDCQECSDLVFAQKYNVILPDLFSQDEQTERLKALEELTQEAQKDGEYDD